MLESEQILNNRYQLKEKLGERPNRQTWLAIDLKAKEEKKQQVVIKLLAFGGQMQWQDLKLFEREAQILREIKHPCIPKYYDYFSIDDRFLWFALVEEYLPGSSLQNLLNQGKRFTEQEVKNIALELLSILSFLHQLKPQILHRDIKPSNMILGEDRQVYLIDFGAVQDKAAVEGASFTVVGTYGYTPIEQFGGRAIPSSDLYALGATLIHLLTGTYPGDLPQKDFRIKFKNVVYLSDRFGNWLTKLYERVILIKKNSSFAQIKIFNNIFGFSWKVSAFNLKNQDDIVFIKKARKERFYNTKLFLNSPYRKIQLAQNLSQAEGEWLMHEIKNWL